VIGETQDSEGKGTTRVRKEVTVGLRASFKRMGREWSLLWGTRERGVIKVAGARLQIKTGLAELSAPFFRFSTAGHEAVFESLAAQLRILVSVVRHIKQMEGKRTKKGSFFLLLSLDCCCFEFASSGELNLLR
jgi:hypothetical protein